ncbi:MAG: pectinesterase family protein [Bacteroidales bacterium]
MIKYLIIGILSVISTFHSYSQKHTYVVAQDGSGDFTSINCAINAAPDNSKSTTLIFVKKGVYREKIFVDKPNITILGESRKETQVVVPILWDNWEREYKAKADTTFEIRWGCAPLNLSAKANDFSLVNITVYNNYGSTVEKTRAHQFTIFGRATRTILLNCDLISDGADNVSLWNKVDGMYYHEGCYFRAPGVDYVCPRGWCYITNCEFEGAAPAQIWHDGDYNLSQKFVIRDSHFRAMEKSWLGRFHRDHQIYLLNCTFDQNIMDRPIEYAYRDRPMNLKKGKRVYYFNCKREGSTPEWMADNLDKAPGKPSISNITPEWTFDGMWNPESKLNELRNLLSR